MPLKEETELQLLRSLSNTPLQVDVTFMAVQSHEAKNTSVSHLNKFIHENGMGETNASIIVDAITKDWLGAVGGVLAILGVIAAPIT